MPIRDQLMSALSNYAQQTQLPVMDKNQEMMFNLYANKPEFAAQYYPAIENQKRTAILQQEQQQKQQQQSALSKIASGLVSGNFDVQNVLAQVGAQTGDPSALVTYMAAKQKQDQANALAQQANYVVNGQGLMQPPMGAGMSAPNSPLNVRNNNAGNMKNPDGTFQTFNNPEAGVNAMAQDLTAKIMGKSKVMTQQYGQGYVPTITNVITTWAPPSENDTAAYIAHVANESGIDPNKPLSVMDVQRIMPAMIKMEGGNQASQYFSNNQQQIPQQAQQQIPQTAPVEPQNTATEQMRRLAAIDPQKTLRGQWAYLEQKIKDEAAQTKVGESVITPENAHLTGQQFADTIEDKDIKNKAMAIVEGRAPYPNLTGRTPKNLKIALEAAQQIDPTLSAATYPMRAKVTKDFASGAQEGKNINALNTAINHLQTMAKAAKDLDNTGVPWWNYVGNKTKSGYDDKFNAKIKAYDAAKLAVADETAKVYKGAGALNEQEQKDWQALFSENNGPKTQQEAIKQTGKLLMGKVDALTNQYNDAFGGVIKKDFLSPKSREILGEFGVIEKQNDASQPPTSKEVNFEDLP